MALRLPAYVPRAAAIVLVALGATATLTYAAGRNIGAAPAASSAAAAAPTTIVVPDVRNEAFVFAKGSLEDAGLAWRVAGSVRGYSANLVLSQTPEPGTKLLDTGAPLVTLTLKRNGSYQQVGSAEDASPYAATTVQRAELAARPLPATKPATAAPAVTTQSVTPKAAATKARAPQSSPAKETAATAQQRPVAFVVPGARKEPLAEMPLPSRAQLLGRWLAAHPKPTDASVKHWLYQNEWIVAGAKLGWWRGAEALQTLIAVDRRTQSIWGVGARSAAIALQALNEVKAHS
jgi:hypothetical protein